MDKIVLILHPFVVGTEVDAANKVLEEASEAREAARRVRECCDSVAALGCSPDTYPNVKQSDCMLYVRLANEIAETIQAACNLAARYGINLQAAMGVGDARVRESHDSNDEGQMTEGAKKIYDRLVEGLEAGK